MKCIGTKYEYYGITFAFLILPLILSIIGVIYYKEITIIFIFLICICIGLLAYELYYIVKFPEKIVFYDKENKKMKVYLNRKNYKEFYLSEIKKITVNRKGKSSENILYILFKDESEIVLSCISNDNTILESVTMIK